MNHESRLNVLREPVLICQGEPKYESRESFKSFALACANL